jgi:Transposase DDE domain group 1
LHHALANQKVGLLRADSGFYTPAILACLESEHINYIIATRLYPTVKRRVYGLSDWVKVCSGIDLAEMYFAHEGGQPRRYVIVRKSVDLKPKACGACLFDDPAYRFSCYVTNLDLPLDHIWNLYNTRADCENRIKELKQDFGLDQFCLHGFWATEASFRFIMIAYNVMSLFRFFALQTHKKSTLSTLRSHCFALGAWMVNHSNRTVLNISLPVKRRAWMTGIFESIQHNPPPFKFSNA